MKTGKLRIRWLIAIEPRRVEASGICGILDLDVISGRNMLILKAGLVYFALVFGAGFVLGTIRTLWIVP